MNAARVSLSRIAWRAFPKGDLTIRYITKMEIKNAARMT
jgi:hypothetical protein